MGWLIVVGWQTHELKGVNAPELKMQVDLLIHEAFLRQSSSLAGFRFGVTDDVPIAHVHTSLSLLAVEAISLEPILFRQYPTWIPSWRDSLTA